MPLLKSTVRPAVGAAFALALVVTAGVVSAVFPRPTTHRDRPPHTALGRRPPRGRRPIAFSGAAHGGYAAGAAGAAPAGRIRDRKFLQTLLQKF